MPQMTIISHDISKAIALLNSEDLVAIPTETVYGLAGNIYSEKAIRKIFEVKERPLYNPLIVHIHAIEQLDALVSHIPDKAKLLAEAFWPGPLTLILKKKSVVPDLITAGKDSVAIRMPNHPVALKLLKGLEFPLAAPSANPFNRISPTKSNHVEGYFKNKIKMVLEGGACKNGIESTIIGFEANNPILYRLGSISIEDIEKVIGKVQIKNKNETAPNAPGMLEKHYSPTTKSILVSNVEKVLGVYKNKSVGLLKFTGESKYTNIQHVEILSETGNLEEATAKLYSALHKLDNLNLDIIILEQFPDRGLGKSINDRLERASQ